LKCLRGREQSKNVDVDMSIILKRDVREMGLECVDWIHMAQDRDRRRVLASTIMKLHVP
jgi:hypothetical protein